MRKIFITISSREYLIGFSTDLKSFLLSIKEDIEFDETTPIHDPNGNYQYANNIFHKGHQMEVHYKSEKIEENETCFYAVKL